MHDMKPKKNQENWKKLQKEYHKGLDNDPGMFEIQILKKSYYKYTIQ